MVTYVKGVIFPRNSTVIELSSSFRRPYPFLRLVRLKIISCNVHNYSWRQVCRFQEVINVIGELIKINASRELKHSYAYHHKPRKRLNWLNRFIPDYLRNLTVKTFTGLVKWKL